tara:strand:+ start:298 stop:894 length:597 start_codon:yes stop_codon:yes gene_type:complete
MKNNIETLFDIYLWCRRKINIYFGEFGTFWSFLGIQSLFHGNGYKNQLSLSALHYRFIYNFKFCTETFLCFRWNKEIRVDYATGSEIEPERWDTWDHTDEYGYTFQSRPATELRECYLYSPWVINSWYNYSGPPKRRVVEDDEGEHIETHKFLYYVKRKKYLWWSTYRVQDRSLANMTKFDRQVDRYYQNMADWGGHD